MQQQQTLRARRTAGAPPAHLLRWTLSSRLEQQPLESSGISCAQLRWAGRTAGALMRTVVSLLHTKKVPSCFCSYVGKMLFIFASLLFRPSSSSLHVLVVLGTPVKCVPCSNRGKNKMHCTYTKGPRFLLCDSTKEKERNATLYINRAAFDFTMLAGRNRLLLYSPPSQTLLMFFFLP